MKRRQKNFDRPNLFAICIPTDHSVHKRRFACFGMHIFRSKCVHFYILKIVDVHELFVDIRAIRSRMIEGGVQLAGFIADLTRSGN